MSSLEITESQIVSSICEYLHYKGYFFWRQNTTPIFNQERRSYRAMPKYSKKGVPDIIIIIGGMFVGLEVKKPGQYLTPDQRLFKADLSRLGSCDRYYLVRSIDDVMKLGF